MCYPRPRRQVPGADGTRDVQPGLFTTVGTWDSVAYQIVAKYGSMATKVVHYFTGMDAVRDSGVVRALGPRWPRCGPGRAANRPDQTFEQPQPEFPVLPLFPVDPELPRNCWKGSTSLAGGGVTVTLVPKFEKDIVIATEIVFPAMSNE